MPRAPPRVARFIDRVDCAATPQHLRERERPPEVRPTRFARPYSRGVQRGNGQDGLSGTELSRGKRVVVLGQAARDLVVRTEGLPESGGSTPIVERIERLGGKGANIAVGVRQLNPEATVSLIAVLGEDPEGDAAAHEASESGLDVGHLRRRGGTALLIDVVSAAGERRLLEHIPTAALSTVADVNDAALLLESADVVVLQLQQPAETLVAAARLAHTNGARIVLDGTIDGEARDALLALAAVVRADAHEATLLAGMPINDRDDAFRAGVHLLARGPSLVALSVPDQGDLVLWVSGHRFYPFGDARVIDPTGGGDAFVAGLVTGLLHGLAPEEVGRLATDAASSTVGTLGGRPDFAPRPEGAAE